MPQKGFAPDTKRHQTLPHCFSFNYPVLSISSIVQMVTRDPFYKDTVHGLLSALLWQVGQAESEAGS